jgi:hypothetical protein
MTRDETIALFLECEAKRTDAQAIAIAEGKFEEEACEAGQKAARRHWNDWAERMLAKRKELEAANLLGTNVETFTWKNDALADFSSCIFGALNPPVEERKVQPEVIDILVKPILIDGSLLDFRGFIFPDKALFKSAVFKKSVRFNDTTFSGIVIFDGATFLDGAVFLRATFSGQAGFDSVTMKRDACFDQAIFLGIAWFRRANFSGSAGFNSVTFSEIAQFDSATFLRGADFRSTAFFGDARFGSVTFSQTARFDSVSFLGAAQFDNAAFLGSAWFTQAHFRDETIYAQARFSRYASFGKACFDSLASFEAIRGDQGLSLAGVVFGTVPNFIEAQFEEPPRLDNVRVDRRALLIQPNWRLWEKAKDAASNSNDTIIGGLSEKLRSQTNARAEALHLAFRNAFVVLDGGSDASHRMYGCLYGLELYAGQNPVPIVPSAVSTASAIQKLISGVMIFLFGLALRNMLKVK